MATERNMSIGDPLEVTVGRKWGNKGVTGLTVSLTIQRSDDQFWTGTTWGARTVLTMSEVSASDYPGEYAYTGPTPATAEVYRCHGFIASGQYAFDEDEIVTAMASVDTLSTAVAAIPTNPLLTTDTRLDHLDTDISSRLAPGGTLSTVTNLTNAPTTGDLTATMKASVTTAASSATPAVTVSDKTGFALTAAYDNAKTAASQASVNAIPTDPLRLATALEDTTVAYALRCAMAMFNGDFVYDSNAKTITFKDRSGTVFSVVSVPDDLTRNRIS